MKKLTLVAAMCTLLACGKDDPAVASNHERNGSTNNTTTANDRANNSNNAPNAAAPITYHRDVALVLQQNCVQCHREGAIGPFELDNYDAVAALGALIKSVTASRLMPPYKIDNSGSCGTFDIQDLTDDEIALIGAWVDAGTPEGDPDDGPPQFEAPLGLDRVDVELVPSQPYTPGGEREDDYRCLIVDNPLDRDMMITGVEVVAGAPDLVHHVILYDLLDEENVAHVEQLEAEDPNPGYSCFGGPRTNEANILAGWVPGVVATTYPEGTGVRLQAGRKYVIQLHYNLSAADAVPDLTTMRLKLEEPGSVTEAYMLPFGNFSMVLPPGGEDVEAITDVALPLPLDVTLWGLIPHMHERGRSMSVSIRRDDEFHCAARVPEWDFHWQNLYFYDRPLTVERGDMLRVRCAYDVSDDTEYVGWGDGTGDEMCFGVAYITLGANEDSRTLDEFEVVADHVGVQSVGTAFDPAVRAQLGGTGDREIRGLEVDDSGNAYVLVYLRDNGNVDLGLGAHQFVGAGAYLARIDADGTASWWLPIDGPAGQFVLDLWKTQNDTLLLPIVTNQEFDVGGNLLTADDGSSYLIEVDYDGNIVDTVSLDRPGFDGAWQVAEGPGGSRHVLITLAEGPLDFAGQTIAQGPAAALLTFDPDGSEAWAFAWTTDRMSNFDVAVDDNGNIAVAGTFRGAISIGPQSAVATGELERTDAFAFFLSPDGTLGDVHLLGNNWNDGFSLAKAIPGGGFVMGGWFGGLPQIAQEASFHGGTDAVLLAFTTDGGLRWSRAFGGAGDDAVWGLAATPNGDIAASLMYGAPLTLMGEQLYHGGLSDLAVTRIDTAGNVVGSIRVGSAGNDGWPQLVATDTNMTVAFWSTGTTVEIGDTVLSSGGAGDIFLADFGF